MGFIFPGRVYVLQNTHSERKPPPNRYPNKPTAVWGGNIIPRYRTFNSIPNTTHANEGSPQCETPRRRTHATYSRRAFSAIPSPGKTPTPNQIPTKVFFPEISSQTTQTGRHGTKRGGVCDASMKDHGEMNKKLLHERKKH